MVPATISDSDATEAWIFIKFYVGVNYYHVSLSFKFHEDPCTNAYARVANARSRDKTGAPNFSALACLQVSRLFRSG